MSPSEVLLGPRLVGPLLVGPWLAIVMFGSALGTAALIGRAVPHRHRPAATATARRYDSIDGLRGYLAVGVMVHHTLITRFYLAGQPWQVPPSHLYTQLGQSSVALFFMISAFLFWGRTRSRRSEIDWPGMLLGRLYRLYPLYLFVLAVLVATVAIESGLAIRTNPLVLAKALVKWLLFTIPGAPDLNGFANTWMVVAGVFWSLRYEWLLYLSLPLLGFLFAGSGRPVAAAVSAACVAILFHLGRTGAIPALQLSIAAAFLGGFAAVHWISSPRRVAFARGRAGGVVAILALLAVVAFRSTAYTSLSILGLTVFFVAVASGQSLGGALRMPAARWLGEISYSVYLFHGFVVWLVLQRVVSPGTLSNPYLFLAVAALIAAGVVVAASLLFVFLEHPAIMAGKRHIRWLTARRPVPAPAPAFAAAEAGDGRRPGGGAQRPS